MLFAPLFLACCSMAHPAVRRELALRAQTALLTGAGFRQEQQRLRTKVAAKHPWHPPFWGLSLNAAAQPLGNQEQDSATQKKHHTPVGDGPSCQVFAASQRTGTMSR